MSRAILDTASRLAVQKWGIKLIIVRKKRVFYNLDKPRKHSVIVPIGLMWYVLQNIGSTKISGTSRQTVSYIRIYRHIKIGAYKG